jgi:hypothetical protein
VRSVVRSGRLNSIHEISAEVGISVGSVHNIVQKDHLPYLADLSPPDLSLFPRLKSVMIRQRLASAEEVTTKVTSSLTEITKNDIQECFKELYEHRKKYVISQGNYFEGNIMYVRLLIFV